MSLRRTAVRQSLSAIVLVAVVAVVVLVLWTGRRPDTVDAGECQGAHGRSNGTGDYADAFHWNGTDYWNLGDSGKSIHLGRQLTTAGCNVADLAERTGRQFAPDPWPDRSSTGLVPGTPVFEIRGVSVTCSLAVPVAGRTKIYVAIVQPTGGRKPGC